MVEKESEKIHSLGYSFIIFTCFLSIFIGKGTYVMFSLTSNDTLICSIFGFLASFVLIAIISYIINKNQNKDIFELNKSIFGKVLGNILNFALWIGFFIVSIIILYNMADFFNTQYLPETSVEYLKMLVILPLIYISTKNLSTLIKMNQILAIVSLLLNLISFIGIYNKIDFINLEPIFVSSKINIIKSVITYFILSIVPLSILLVTNKNSVKDSERLNKNLIKVFILTNIILILIIAFTILILGPEYLEIFRFPEYITLKQFSLFNILERVENILALNYYFNCTGLLAFLYYFLINYMPQTKYRRYYSIIIAILQVLVTKIIFKNTISFIEVLKGYFVYAVFFFILLPILITFLKLFFNNIKNKKMST